VADAASSPLVSRRLVSLGLSSLLFVPLPGQIGHVGALAVGWRAGLTRLDDVAQTTIEVLSTEAGGVLERAGVTARLVHEAESDPLTGLLNRRSFNVALSASKSGDSVVMIDLDRFKSVNDRYGHTRGDETLRAMATCIRGAARGSDAVCRWGWEEFAVVLVRTDAAGAGVVVERVRELWAEARPLTSFSAGIAERLDGEGPIMTLRRADEALYQRSVVGVTGWSWRPRGADSPAWRRDQGDPRWVDACGVRVVE